MKLLTSSQLCIPTPAYTYSCLGKHEQGQPTLKHKVVNDEAYRLVVDSLNKRQYDKLASREKDRSKYTPEYYNKAADNPRTGQLFTVACGHWELKLELTRWWDTYYHDLLDETLAKFGIKLSVVEMYGNDYFRRSYLARTYNDFEALRENGSPDNRQAHIGQHGYLMNAAAAVVQSFDVYATDVAKNQCEPPGFDPTLEDQLMPANVAIVATYKDDDGVECQLSIVGGYALSQATVAVDELVANMCPHNLDAKLDFLGPTIRTECTMPFLNQVLISAGVHEMRSVVLCQPKGWLYLDIDEKDTNDKEYYGIGDCDINVSSVYNARDNFSTRQNTELARDAVFNQLLRTFPLLADYFVTKKWLGEAYANAHFDEARATPAKEFLLSLANSRRRCQALYREVIGYDRMGRDRRSKWGRHANKYF